MTGRQLGDSPSCIGNPRLQDVFTTTLKEYAMTPQHSDECMNERERIDLLLAADLEKWSQAFGVTVPQLISAVSAVGDRASRVQSYLQALA
jgi:hypothetical protein